MKEQTKQFMAAFIKTFCIMNFVVGTVAYILVPDTVSPVPEPFAMFLLGIVTAAMAFAGMVPRE